MVPEKELGHLCELMSQQATFRPQEHKYKEIALVIQSKNFKKAKKMLENFEKTALPKNCPPYFDILRVSLLLEEGKHEDAVVLARKIEQTQPTNQEVLEVLTNAFKQSAQVADAIKMYNRLCDTFPNSTEYLPHALFLTISVGDYENMQKIGLQIAKRIGKSSSYQIGGFCSYARAKHDKNSIFYKFAINLFDKFEATSPDTVELKFYSMMNLNNTSEAMDYLRSETSKKLFESDQLQYHRLEIKGMIALNKFEEAANIAENILETINNESLDEWRLVVKYHSNPESVIQKYLNDRSRGPDIALIELALKNHQDPFPFIKKYIDKYAGRPFVRGDLEKYFTQEILSQLKNVQDLNIKTLATNAPPAEVSDEFTAILVAQDKIRNNQFMEAYKTLVPYSTNNTAKFLMMRLSGMIGCTVNQRILWDELKLEGIHYLSLANTYLIDHMYTWNLKSLLTQLTQTYSYTFLGFQQFDMFITQAIFNQNYMAIDDLLEFRESLVRNLTSYFAYILRIWMMMLESIDRITAFKAEKFKTIDELASFEEKVDDSIIVLHYNDQKLKDIIFPTIVPIAKTFNQVVRILFAMKLNPESVDQEIGLLEPIAKNTKWEPFVTFVKGGCQDIEERDDLDLYVIGSIAIASRIKGTNESMKSQVINALVKAQNTLEASLNFDSWPSELQDKIEAQKECINDATNQVKSILE